MLEVIQAFVDKYNPEKIYRIGEKIKIEDKERVQDMIERKLVKEIKEVEEVKKVKEIKEAKNQRGRVISVL